MKLEPKPLTELADTEPETYQGSASPHNVMVKHINQVLAAEHKHMLEFQAEQRQLLAEKRARHERERAEQAHQTLTHIIPNPTDTEDTDMNLKQFASAAVIATSLLTSSCGDAKGPPATAKTELYKRNPNPQQGYEITAHINNPPGAFEYAKARVYYQSKGCSYVLNSFEGVNSSPRQSLELPLTKIGDNEYTTKVYLDEMIDEDYYGNGVCQWFYVASTIGFMATGAKNETVFSADLWADQVPATQPITYYFWNKSYPIDVAKMELNKKFPDINQTGSVEFGAKNISNVPIERRNEFFSVTLTVKPIHP